MHGADPLYAFTATLGYSRRRWAWFTTNERAATMHSLMETASLTGVNPEAYLRQVLSVVADYSVNQVADLLPWNVAIASS